MTIKTKSFKGVITFFSLVMLLIPAFCEAAYVGGSPAGTPPVFMTGRDWSERMTPGEKFMSVIVPMTYLHYYGVPFRKNVTEYISILDRLIMEYPYIDKEDVMNIFVSYVYAAEPESRAPFQRVEEALRRANFSLGGEYFGNERDILID